MRKIPVLIPFLALITILFLSILVFAYVETKKANPQMIETSKSSPPPMNADERRCHNRSFIGVYLRSSAAQNSFSRPA
jgi:hypothetical protein